MVVLKKTDHQRGLIPQQQQASCTHLISDSTCLLLLFCSAWVSSWCSATLVDDKVDTLDAASAPLVPQKRFRLPVPGIDDIRDALCILEPPAITIVAQEVQANVSLSNVELGDFWLSLANLS